MHDQWTQPCFPLHTKHFYIWHPESEDLFSLQLHGCNVLFRNFRETSFALCLSHMCRALLRANLHISVFYACATRPKVASVSSSTKRFGYSLEKSERLHLFVFSQMTKNATLKGYSYFPNALLIFIIFRNEYGRDIAVGMHARSAWSCLQDLCSRQIVHYYHYSPGTYYGPTPLLSLQWSAVDTECLERSGYNHACFTYCQKICFR